MINSKYAIGGMNIDAKLHTLLKFYFVLQTFMFDETWKIWTGASELLAKLLKMYSVAGMLT